MDRFAEDMLNSGRAVLGEDSSVMARMQRKFWNTKQVLIKATGKKEDEYVVASDADLDAKLEFFRSVQSTCTELLKVIEKYQYRITRLSQEENELGLFLRFQGEHDRTKAGNMMNATSKALCTSAKQRMALCPPLQRLQQEVETFRRRAIADTLLTVSRMEKSRTEYRGALLWMKDASQQLDPDTYKQLEKFRKVQAQVRGTKSQFEKLKNDVCQKVDMLGASRCNMLSHSLCTYQTTLLHFWERTAHTMSGIHEAFQGHVPYQFTTLKGLRDPLDHLDSEKQEEKKKSHPDSLLSLGDDDLLGGAGDVEAPPTSDIQNPWTDGAATSPSTSNDDLMLMAYDTPKPLPPPPTPIPVLPPPPQSGRHIPPQRLKSPRPRPSRPAVYGDELLHTFERTPRNEEETEPSDMAFLKDLLSPSPGSNEEFCREWLDAFGTLDSPTVPPISSGQPAAAATAAASSSFSSFAAAAAPHPPTTEPPSPTGFLPSQLLDHSMSSTGWATPPMFQAPPLQPPVGVNQSTQPALNSATKAVPGASKDMSAWFDLFADLDPLSNPDAIGRSADELLNA